MNGNKNAVIDSNIIIYLSKNMSDIAELGKYERFHISIITYMEVLGYPFRNPDEQKATKELINLFDIVNLDHDIANEVIKIRANHKIKLPDAIILATAQLLNADLLTNNTRDFANITNLSVISPINIK